MGAARKFEVRIETDPVAIDDALREPLLYGEDFFVTGFFLFALRV
jgi:hypothetical protein